MKVDGTVKLKGQPLQDGTVSFEPLDGQPSRATAIVSAGAYSIPRASGLVPGKYLIRISAGDGKTAVNPVDPSKPPGPGGSTNIISKELVPADWNVKSNQERTVAKDGSNRFEFDIP
ncbi:carboxypeptidase-like regulatory domain-containing protein [Frigoriglobus tundricola]|uniref:carboxypeptidase-like regulatory domain-containing protein n=1 Tax=Frigoriglobus tundricola TaxID=2774151 RepID=UPI00148ECA9E|nr:carboxypeptidase-like regulatory domain-containing protein [Frigoriglobus tundricola]